MGKKVKNRLSCLVIMGFFISSLLSARLAILTPVNPKTGYSEIIPLKGAKKLISNPIHYSGKGVVDTLSYYDPNSENIYWGIDVGDTMVEWFRSSVACSLLAAYIQVYNREVSNSQVYWFISGVPDTLVSHFGNADSSGLDSTWFDYHLADTTLPPGPSPIDYDRIYASGYDSLNGQSASFDLGVSLSSPVDVGRDPFIIGFVPLTQGTGGSAEPWAVISAGSQGNNYGYHALVYQQNFGSSFPGASPGWYANWHTYWAYAIVNIYEHTGPYSDTLSVLSLSGIPGDTITLPVVLNHQEYVSGLQTNMVFDTSLLHFLNLQLNPIYSSNFSISSNASGDSIIVVIVSFSGDSITPGMDTLFYADFIVDSSATLGDSTCINLTNSVLSDPQARQIGVETLGGCVYFRGVKGDLNYDGTIDVTDVVRIINIILGNPPAPSPYEEWAADVNSDGQIDVVDVVATINIILGRGKGSDGSLADEWGAIWLNGGKVMLSTNTKISGVQFDLVGKVRDIRKEDLPDGLEMFSGDIAHGKRILMTSLTGGYIAPGIVPVVSFEGSATIRNVVLVDKNGNKVKLKSINRFSLSDIRPNPVTKGNHLSFDVVLFRNATLKVKIMDVSGRVVKFRKINGTAGKHDVSINVSELQDGVYFLGVEYGSQKVVRKFVIRKEL